MRRAAGLLARTAGRGLLLANPEGRGVEWLSPSAAVVWDALAEPRTQEELVRSVADRVGEPPGQVRAGVGTLIARLRVRGLVIDDHSQADQADSAR